MRFDRFAAVGFAVSLSISTAPAHAGDLGCTFLLCMAGNWKHVTECVSPVKKALRKMIRGWTPHCDLVDSSGSVATAPGTYMQIRHEVYQSCTEGYGAGYQDAYFDHTQTLQYGNGSGMAGWGGFAGPQCAMEVSRVVFTTQAPPDTANYCVTEVTGGSRFQQRKTRICTDVEPKQEWEEPDFVDVYIDGQLYNRTFWTEADAAGDEEVPPNDPEE